MKISNLLPAVCVIILIMISCSKKTTPSDTSTTSTPTTTSPVPKKTDSVVVKKPVKAKPLASVPKVNVVNDASAKRSVDGRLYYDLQGKRYWRSNKDGKYYLYNKSMHNDPAFKAPAKTG